MKNVAMLSTLLVAALSVGASGCGQTDGDLCQSYSARLRACFGEAAVPPTCDPNRAALYADASCSTLSQAMLTAKADGDLPASVKKAVDDAVREAIKTGLEAALKQLLPSLGDLDQWTYYLVLASLDDETSAEAQRLAFADALAGEPDMAPFVYAKEKSCFFSCDKNYWVLHGPCSIPVTQLVSRVTDLVMDHPKLLSLLGGSGSTQTTAVDDTSAITSFSLPFAIFPMPKEAPANFGCVAP